MHDGMHDELRNGMHNNMHSSMHNGTGPVRSSRGAGFTRLAVLISCHIRNIRAKSCGAADHGRPSTSAYACTNSYARRRMARLKPPAGDESGDPAHGVVWRVCCLWTTPHPDFTTWWRRRPANLRTVLKKKCTCSMPSLTKYLTSRSFAACHHASRALLIFHATTGVDDRDVFFMLFCQKKGAACPE